MRNRRIAERNQSLGITEKGSVETSLSFTTFLPLLKGKLCLFYAKIWLFVIKLWGNEINEKLVIPRF